MRPTAYRRLGYLIDEEGNLSQERHGHQVLDIAAGLVPPDALRASAKPARDDAASAAALLFVDVPEPGPEDSTGAAADAYLLDGLHYILRRAGPQARVIVNISVGALAGSHDGHSLIEQAIDELQQQHPNLIITVAAGNGAEERWHAAGLLPPAEKELQRTGLVWQTLADDPTDSFMELWFAADAAEAFEALQLRLQAPDGRVIEAGIGQIALLQDALGGLQASLDFRRQPPAGRAGVRAMALIALAPACGARAGLAGGAWRIELAYDHPDLGCQVDAWLQRDTPGRSRLPVRQSYIDSTWGVLRINGARAVSSLATGERTVVVGAARASDGSRSPYSPQHVDVYAAADEDAASPGLLSSGALSGSLARMSGTSGAAPVVARALANHLGEAAARAQLLGNGESGKPGKPDAPANWPQLAAQLGEPIGEDARAVLRPQPVNKAKALRPAAS